MIFGAPELPRLGQTVLAATLETYAGGKGLNQAFAAARAGASVSMVSGVGNDATGALLLRALQEESISTDHVIEFQAPSGVSAPIVVPSGDNGIMFHGGANKLLTRDHMRLAAPAISAADVLTLQLELPVQTAIEAAQIAQRSGTTVVLNTAPAADVPDELLALTSVLVANQFEADTLSGHIGTTASQLRDELAPETVVITRGTDGVSWATPQEVAAIDAWSVAAVDTVGAGDTFAGALAAQLALASSLSDAISFATAAAALCVTRAGASTAIPTVAEVEAFVASTPAKPTQRQTVT